MTNDDLTRIEIDQYYPHAPEKIWRALTTPELMEQWLMPNDFRPVVGHHFSFESRPVEQTGFSGRIACEVLELVPSERLRISWRDAADPDTAPMTVTWDLRPEGDGTRLFLEHAGFDPDDPQQQLARTFMSKGWRSHVLRRLEEVLDETA